MCVRVCEGESTYVRICVMVRKRGKEGGQWLELSHDEGMDSPDSRPDNCDDSEIREIVIYISDARRRRIVPAQLAEQPTDGRRNPR